MNSAGRFISANLHNNFLTNKFLITISGYFNARISKYLRNFGNMLHCRSNKMAETDI